MPFITVTYTFANSTTADATQVNQNFTDLINGTSDGTKNFTISALTVNSTATMLGNVQLGNSGTNTVTFNGSLLSNISLNSNNTYAIGAAGVGLSGLYLGAAGGFTTQLQTAATANYTFKFPTTAGSSGNLLQTDGSGNTSWIAAPPSPILQVTPSTYTATLTAGENISIRDAVCIDLSSGVYKVFRADYTIPNRRATFFGFATAAATTGNAVTVIYAGVLQGFSALTVGAIYYLGNSPGAITTSPSDSSPISVCQAWASDTIFISPRSLTFSASVGFLSTHGSTAGSGAASVSNSGENFNFSSWAAITADGTSLYGAGHGENILSSSGKHVVIDGLNSSSTIVAANRQWDKSSWTSGANRGTPLWGFEVGQLSNKIFCGGGSNNVAGQTTVDQYDGTSWSSGVGSITQNYVGGCFSDGTQLHYAGGNNNATAHQTWNGSASSSATALPANTTAATSGQTGTSKGLVGGSFSSSSASYQWNGSWSASLTMTYVADTLAAGSVTGSSSGYNSSTLTFYSNGGNSSSTVSINNTASFNGASWSSSTASTNSKNAHSGCIL